MVHRMEFVQTRLSQSVIMWASRPTSSELPECVICLDNAADQRLQPCGCLNAAFCGDCARRLSTCPICRTRVTALVGPRPPPIKLRGMKPRADPRRGIELDWRGVELGPPPFPAEPDEERDAARALSLKLPLKAAKQVTTLCKLRGAACTSPFCGAADPRARFDWLVVEAARCGDVEAVEHLLSMPLGMHDRCTPDLLGAVLRAAVSGGHAIVAALALRYERIRFDHFAVLAAAAEISDESRGHRVLDVVLPRVHPNTLKTWTLWEEVHETDDFRDEEGYLHDDVLVERDRFKRGSSPLYHALETGALWLFDRLLADPRVDPSLTKRRDKRAPLLLATLRGDVERVRALIRRGARVDVTEWRGLGHESYAAIHVDELALSLCREAVFLAYERMGWLGNRARREQRRSGSYTYPPPFKFSSIQPSDAMVQPIELRDLCVYAQEEYAYIMNVHNCALIEYSMGYASGQFLVIDYQPEGDAALTRREFELVFAHASGRSACARLVRAARAWNVLGGWVALRALLERSRSGAPRALVEVACGHRPFKTVLTYLSAMGKVYPRNDARLWKCPPALLARLKARPTPDGGFECISPRSWS